MIDSTRKRREQAQKDRVRRRINTKIDPENYEFRPAKKQVDYYDNEVEQRVAVYARVSTGNVQQTTSYELQKKYYEDFVIHHPNWTLVKIYADEGISGTSLAHRDEFNQMISDCRAGKIDMIITKSVSRFARNVVDCISMVRMLAELSNPVGVFFESECIFSLKDDSQMALSFQATMAQEESHIRSRSMETSLRTRLDGGLPLTPKLLGYSHDSEGNLVINPEEESTVRLIFYMYLYGYSTAEIAQILTEQGRKTYALMQLVSAAEDSRNLLMQSQTANAAFISNQPESFWGKVKAGTLTQKLDTRMKELREGLCAINMVSLAEAIAYQELGESDAAKLSLEYFAKYIEKTYLEPAGFIERLDMYNPTPERYWSNTLPEIKRQIFELSSTSQVQLLEGIKDGTKALQE